MRKILEEYFKHLKTNPQTLMPRIFGLHKITETIKKSIKYDDHLTYYLIVMNNFFNTKDKFVDRYDLKGSWVGR
jgi:1-phosphatidylinositol-4-phosphate 5-kinase